MVNGEFPGNLIFLINARMEIKQASF